jgi:hypothetical protein
MSIALPMSGSGTILRAPLFDRLWAARHDAKSTRRRLSRPNVRHNDAFGSCARRRVAPLAKVVKRSDGLQRYRCTS